MSDAFDHPGEGTPSHFPAGFRAAVSHALAGMGYAVGRWEPDGVHLIPPDQGDRHFLGLSNLYRRAKGADRADWPALIRGFLGTITGVLAKPDFPDDLTPVLGQLRPRLGKPSARKEKVRPWGTPLAGTDLEIHLVIDYPHTMAYVTDDMLRQTDRSAEDLLDIALANLKADTPPDFLQRVTDEIDIAIGHTGDGYAAARALLVEDLVPDAPAGVWVAVPSRDELAVWPVSFPALGKIHVIKMFAQDNYRDHAYPVTDDVYWVWRGAWYPFDIRLDDANITVTPPEEFMTAMKELAGGAE